MRKPESRRLMFSMLYLVAGMMTLFVDLSCRTQTEERKANPPTQAAGGEGMVLATTDLDLDFSKHKVTFIELGADRCIPCKAMQPIMREIAAEYAGKIQVVFYDVWKDPSPAQKYRIQLIPTQVFIDRSGKEISRHVGFYAKEEILTMLKEKRIL